MTIAVRIDYFDGCPGWEVARARLVEAAARLGVELEVELCRVETIEAAQRLGFTGSPTIRIGGRDPFAQPGAVPALACRLYMTPEGLAGSPTTEQLVAVLAGQAQAG